MALGAWHGGRRGERVGESEARASDFSPWSPLIYLSLIYL